MRRLHSGGSGPVTPLSTMRSDTSAVRELQSAGSEPISVGVPPREMEVRPVRTPNVCGSDPVDPEGMPMSSMLVTIPLVQVTPVQPAVQKSVDAVQLARATESFSEALAPSRAARTEIGGGRGWGGGDGGGTE